VWLYFRFPLGLRMVLPFKLRRGVLPSVAGGPGGADFIFASGAGAALPLTAAARMVSVSARSRAVGMV
jgi:hypothetical protein